MAWYEAEPPKWLTEAVITNPQRTSELGAQLGMQYARLAQEGQLEQKRLVLQQEHYQIMQTRELQQLDAIRERNQIEAAKQTVALQEHMSWERGTTAFRELLSREADFRTPDYESGFLNPSMEVEANKIVMRYPQLAEHPATANYLRLFSNARDSAARIADRQQARELEAIRTTPTAVREAQDLARIESDTALKLRQAEVARDEGDETTASRLESEAASLKRQREYLISRRPVAEHTRIVEAETITRKRREAAEARAKGDEALATALEHEATYIETTAPHQGLEQAVDYRSHAALVLTAQKSIQKLEAELAAAQVWEHAYATDPKKMSELAFTKPPRASVQVAAELEALRQNLTILQSVRSGAAAAPTNAPPAAPAIDPNDPLGILNPAKP